MCYRARSLALASCVMLGLAMPAIAANDCLTPPDGKNASELEAIIANCNREIASQSARAEPSRVLLARFYVYRAMAFESKDDFASAKADYDNAIKFDPGEGGRAVTYEGRARVAHLTGDEAGALVFYGEAIKAAGAQITRSQTHGNYFNRSLLYLVTGQYDQAIADADEMIRLEPTASKYDHRATAYALKGDLVKAHADATEAIRLIPTGAYHFSMRGWVYELAGQLDHALVDHGEAVRLDPKSADAYAYRARARAAKGDTVRAQEDVDLAVKLDPEVGDTFANLNGISFERGGQRERALVEYEWPLRFNPKLTAAIQGRDRIRTARQ